MAKYHYNWSGRGLRGVPTISFKFVPGRGREKAQVSPRRLVSRSCCRAVFRCPSQHKSIISCYRLLIGKSWLQSYFSEWLARWLLINWERLRVKDRPWPGHPTTVSHCKIGSRNQLLSEETVQLKNPETAKTGVFCMSLYRWNQSMGAPE